MSVDKATLKRLDELALRNQHLEKKLMNVQEVLSSLISWQGQSAGSLLSHAETVLLLEQLHK